MALEHEHTAGGAGSGADPRRSPGLGCFTELSPQEFATRKDLVVLLIKAPHAAPEFSGFRRVVPVACSSQELADVLDRRQPVGLVCEDGTCSGRLAIRLSQEGFTVVHLSGGLREWHYAFRTPAPAPADG